jgi:ribokinase
VAGRVIVVGSINIDLVTFIERLPRPGETISGGRFAQVHGGKGANQAVAAARLGADVSLVGVVGRDEFGDSARASLRSEGVSTEFIGTGDSPTGVAQIMVDAAGENLISVAPGANVEVTEEMVRDAFERIDSRDAVVLTVLEVPEATVTATAELARRKGWTFVLDPAPARVLGDDLLALCDVLTPNEHEIAGLGKSGAQELLEAGAGAVVVTKGRGGVDVYRSGRPLHHHPAFPMEPVDTTGAGDSFSGALAVALTEGSSLEDAAGFACAAAALSVRGEGARGGMPGRAEVEGLVKNS